MGRNVTLASALDPADGVAAASPIVSDLDLHRLRDLVALLRSRGQDEPAEALEQELEVAAVVPAGEVPPTVVTMNATVEVRDLDTATDRSFTVVFPGTGAVGGGRVSVLAPVGMALLGARVGDEVTWPAPGRTRRARIRRVFRPDTPAPGDG